MKCAVKFLIAEDDNLNRIMLAKLMSRFHAECIIAKDGQEAINFFETDKFDAVFLDVNMPIYSGPECAAIIRKHCADTGTAVPQLVCISADDDYMNSDIFDFFLSKPFSMDTIKSFIDKILESKQCIDDYSLEKAGEVIGLDAETMAMLLDEFISSFEEELAELKKAIEENNPEMITHIAHKMKGAAANMQMEPLRDLCADMQQIEKNNSFKLTHLFERISSSYNSFKRHLYS